MVVAISLSLFIRHKDTEHSPGSGRISKTDRPTKRWTRLEGELHINLTLLFFADIKLGEERTHSRSLGFFLSFRDQIVPLNFLIDVVNFD